MPLVADECICLHKVEYSESSQILTLFGRDHGIIHVVAKGAHRRTKAGASRFDGGIDLLDRGSAVFTDDTSRELTTLTEWKLIDGHLELRRSLRGLHLAMYAVELVSLLIESHDPHMDVFARLGRTLPELAGNRAEEAMLAWELDLLKAAGYLPEFFVCVNCHRGPDGKPIYFSPSRGGVICRNCEGVVRDRLNFDERLMRLVQSILRLPRVGGVAQRLPKLTRAQTDPLNRLLAEHIGQTLGKRLRMWEYVGAELDRPGRAG